PGFFLFVVPGFLRLQPGAQALDRLLGPGFFHFLLAAVAARVVGGGVVAEAVGDRFDDAGAFAVARALHGITDGLAHGDDVVAVHLHGRQARGDALLRQGFGAGLDVARHRDRPLVVDDHGDHRQLARAGDVDGTHEVALAGAAVADGAYGHALFVADLEGQRRAGRMQALRADRHRPREIVARRFLLVVVAAFVAAPVGVDVARFHAAVQLRAVLAVADRQHVLRTHGAADADVGGFVAQAAGVGAELAGALQGDRLGFEHARGDHQLVQLDHVVQVLGEVGQVLADQLAFGVEVLQVWDFELGGDGHELPPGKIQKWGRGPLLMPVASRRRPQFAIIPCRGCTAGCRRTVS